MHKLRFIISGPGSGPGNMAVDEALFAQAIRCEGADPVMRVYTWQRPCVTIGYFQKHSLSEGYGLTVTRRLTGGLTVAHNKDLSFSFILDNASWPHVYAQDKTYELIHSSIRSALAQIGIEAEFVSADQIKPETARSANICVETLYPYDLKIKNRKIVGSCQRRRGKNLLVQGSIHLMADVDRNAFINAWGESLCNLFRLPLFNDALSGPEKAEAASLESTKYSAEAWNKKY